MFRARLSIAHFASPGSDAARYRAHHGIVGRQHLCRRTGAPSVVLSQAGPRLGEILDASARLLSERLGQASRRRHHGRIGTTRSAPDLEGRAMTQSRYDAIVIGAGVSGLVAAHYLARAGRRVLVVEREPTPSSSFDIGWVPPQVVRDLDLERRGLRFTEPDPWIAAPLEGGGRLELSRDLNRSVEAIRHISPADAANWPEFCMRMRKLATVLERLYVAPPPDVESRDPRELARIAGVGLYVRRLGKQTIIDLARVLPMSIAELLDDWFETDAL